MSIPMVFTMAAAALAVVSGCAFDASVPTAAPARSGNLALTAPQAAELHAATLKRLRDALDTGEEAMALRFENPCFECRARLPDLDVVLAAARKQNLSAQQLGRLRNAVERATASEAPPLCVPLRTDFGFTLGTQGRIDALLLVYSDCRMLRLVSFGTETLPPSYIYVRRELEALSALAGVER